MLKQEDKEISGPVLNVFRAPTDNDRHSPYILDDNGWYEVGLNQLKPTLKKIEVDIIKKGQVRVNTVHQWSGKKSTGFRHYSIYNIFSNGWIFMDNRVEPYGNLPVLSKIGLKMILPGSLERLQWFGRGAHESYPDRKMGAEIGLYQSTVEKQEQAYVFPQEMGNKEEVRWISLLDEKGEGLMFTSENNTMSASALPYTASDLDSASHTNQLIHRDEVILCLNHRQTGLGNKSCGPETMEKYKLYPKPVNFRFSIRPLNKNLDPKKLFRKTMGIEDTFDIKKDNPNQTKTVEKNKKSKINYVDPSDYKARRDAGYEE